MPLKHKGSEASSEAKRRKRVGFAEIDPGVEASKCVKIFLVKSEEEVGSTNSFCIDPVDLNQLFGDGKIYGYRNLKVNVWLSLVSFHACSEVTYDSKHDGGKGITDLNAALQEIFGELLIDREQLIQKFSTEYNYINDVLSCGVIVPRNSLVEDDNSSNLGFNTDGSTVEVVRLKMSSTSVDSFYGRLVPLMLLLVDGGSPLDVTDPRWEIFLLVKKSKDQPGNCVIALLGFATVYHFFHYPDSTRLRIGQILVFPTYQGQGLGRRLIESVYSVAISENMYDVTIEEPSGYLQYLRDCMDTIRLLSFEPIKLAIDEVVSQLKEGSLSKQICRSSSSPPASLIEIARQKLKINKKQFRGCWEVLIYLNLDPANKLTMGHFKTWVSDREKGDIVGKDATDHKKQLIEVPNDYGHDMTFVVCWSTNKIPDARGGNLEEEQPTQEQLKQLVDKRIEDIVMIADKVRSIQARG